MAQKHTGTSLARVEDAAFLTGAAVYIDDLRDPLLDTAAYVVFVRSTMAHARVINVDVTEAKTAPGVLDVVTGADHIILPAGPTYGIAVGHVFTQPLLAETKVRYTGEPVAAVVAKTQQEAVDAAELVVVDLDPLPPVLDFDEAVANETHLFEVGDAPQFQPSAGDQTADEPGNGNIAFATQMTAGTLDPAATVTVTERVWNPRQAPAPMEPRGIAAAWDAQTGDLHVWAATQRPHGFRSQLAEFYELDEHRIHVVAPEVGGGFGGKVSRSVEEHIIPELARRVGRPVRWTDTRSEFLASGTQGRAERFDMTLHGDTDGKIYGVAIDLVKDLGAYPGVGTYLAEGYTLPMACGTYDIGWVDFAATCVVTNRVTIGAFRGAGRAPYIGALERMVDIYANEIGVDPADVRRSNLIRPDTMPVTTIAGATYDEANYPADLERVLAAAGYEDLRAEQERRRADGSTNQLGIGIACYCHKTAGGGGEEAHVRVNPDATAIITTGTTSQGHGHATAWSQIAGDVLGIDPSDITVIEGVTDAIATGIGAVGSRSLQMAGLAIHNSASEVVGNARKLAAQLLEANVADVMLDTDTGTFHVVGTPSLGVSWVDVAESLTDATANELSCGEFYENQGRDTYPSGAAVAVVEVDTETGHVRLERFVSVDDTGVRVNPMIVDGQLHGGIANGLAQVLGEEVIYDADGNLLTSNFMDYAIASIDWFPMFELHASETASSHNTLGFKAVGESGVMAATPSMHNAIVDAVSHLGVRHLELPCTPERVWQAIAATDPPVSALAGGHSPAEPPH